MDKILKERREIIEKMRAIAHDLADGGMSANRVSRLVRDMKVELKKTN